MDIVVPKWGVTMDEARIVAWHKRVGDTVELDEPVAELETDKATGDIESQVAGRITELLVEEGAEVEAGQVIARVEPDPDGSG